MLRSVDIGTQARKIFDAILQQSQLVADNEQLKRQNQKLSKRLQQAEIIIEFQKKLAEALGIPLTGDSIE